MSTYHKKRRSKRILQTELDQIPGIGPKKSTLLLKHFGSLKQIKKASQKELEDVEGLSSRDIKSLVKFQQK